MDVFEAMETARAIRYLRPDPVDRELIEKLIWAATTPLKDSTNATAGDPSRASNARVAARNNIARECLKDKKIPVDDLFALVNGHSEYYNDGVHFNREGIALQSEKVAASIETLLPH